MTLDKDDIATANEMANTLQKSKNDELIVVGNLLAFLLKEREALANHIVDVTKMVAQQSPQRSEDPNNEQVEPVAWMIWLNGHAGTFAIKREAQLEFERRNEKYPDDERKLIPLYTHPPVPTAQPKQCWKCGDMDAKFQTKCDVPACGMKEPEQKQNLKLMPREATPEMLKAMDECSTEGYDERLYEGHAGSVYMAAWGAFHGQHCYCGDITNLGVIHCDDGPCHYPEHTSEYKRGYADAMNWKVQNHLEHLQPKVRTGDCLLTGVCASEGYKIQPKEPEQDSVSMADYMAIVEKYAFLKASQPEKNPAALKLHRGEDINLSCKSTQARLAASWGYVKAEPLTDEWEKAYDLGWQAGFCAPPHKPLTDAQIEKVLGDFPYYSNEWEENEHKRFARAIEAAHGIKG